MDNPDFSPRLGKVLDWLNSPEGRLRTAAYADECRKRDSARVLKYRNARLARDAGFRRLTSWRNRLRSCLFRKWGREGAVVRGRSEQTMFRLVGCGYQAMREHMEAQFRDGMNWQNHGKSGWHIDHKRPVWEFDWEDEGQFVAMNHFTNLQPLWHYENRAKGLIEMRLARMARTAKISLLH